MKCKYPIVRDGRAFGCGQCLCCRVNRRRIWAHRLILEAGVHEANAFVTLSYADDQLPEDNGLDPDHLRKYLMRLRKKLYPQRFRYFACGEYGGETDRPHYHLALFGLPTCRYGQSRWSRDSQRCCDVCEMHRSVWGKGHVYCGQLTEQSSAYVCGYVLKKVWRERKGGDLGCRYPEFARMSSKPGLGAWMMDEVASKLMELGLDTWLEDVPRTLAHGRKEMPLGPYLVRRLRTRIGRDKNAPLSVHEKNKEELRTLREAAHATARPGFKEVAFREAVIQMNAGKIARVEGLSRIRKGGETL